MSIESVKNGPLQHHVVDMEQSGQYRFKVSFVVDLILADFIKLKTDDGDWDSDASHT